MEERELLPIVDEVLKPVVGLGDYFNINAPIVGTDNFDFMLQGVPNLVGIHKPHSMGQIITHLRTHMIKSISSNSK